MKKVLICVLLVIPALWAIDERLETADYYYLNHHMSPTYLTEARNLCENVLEDNPSSWRALWRLARLYVSFGDNRSDADAKISRYEKARDYAERAKALNDNGCECHFWYGVALGRIGQTRGVLNSLSLAGPVKRAFERALELNPRFTPAMDGLAIWYLEVPAVAGGDINKSIEYLKRGISIDPNYSLLYVDLAKVYIKRGNYSAARENLNKCLAVTNPTNPADFYLDDKPDAQRLLAEMQGR